MNSTFSSLIGHRINAVFLANANETIVFRTTEGKYLRFDTCNDCCNTVWFNHINGSGCVGQGDTFDLIRGALVIGCEDKDWTENRAWTPEDGGDYGDTIQDGFYTIKTDRGYIDLEVRNDHNGYYGGTVMENEDLDWEITDLENLVEIKEDF